MEASNLQDEHVKETLVSFGKVTAELFFKQKKQKGTKMLLFYVNFVFAGSSFGTRSHLNKHMAL